MYGLLIVVLSAIITLGGCTQPESLPDVASQPQPESQVQAEPKLPVAEPVRELVPVAVTELATAPSTVVAPAAPATTSSVEAATVATAPMPVRPKEKAPVAPPSQPSAASAAPVTPLVAVPVAAAPSTKDTTPPPIPPSAAASPKMPPPQPTMSFAEMEQRLRDTKAIGMFTKLSLKNQVDDLLGAFKKFYQGQLKVELAELRQRYETLLMKVLTLVQDSDQQLAGAIRTSREAIWGVLADPQEFAKI